MQNSKNNPPPHCNSPSALTSLDESYKKRYKSLDGLKYLLIVLVIIGHWIEPSRYTNSVSCILYSIIYAFHMPLFIFLSGYFFKNRPFKEEIKKMLPFIEIILVGNVLACIAKGNMSFSSMIYPLSTQPLWYLISLIAYRVGTSALLKKFSVKHLLYLSIAVEILMFTFYPIEGRYLNVMRTCLFYPMFVLGYTLKGNIDRINNYKKWIISFGILSFIYVLCTSSRLQHLFMFHRETFIELQNLTDINALLLYIYRYSIVFCSIFCSAFVLLYTKNNTFISRFSKWGQYTLFIYFAQTILMAPINKYVSSFPYALVVSVLTVIPLTYIAPFPITKILMNPISSLFSKIKSLKIATN